MINIIAIHMEIDGSNHLEHIAKLRWSKASSAGQHTSVNPQEATRAQMYKFVSENPKQAYAISQQDNTYAFLEVVNAKVQYVKTVPDSTKSDNLLSLPRY